ncbi:MAG: hypothetical protein H0W72_01100 [Planctomycetes bacterium]|nr:hypothetical protein [Planctomycetota bacterium]
MRLDFHLHTCRSDGQLKPSELLAAVRRARLEAWAVTDHDTLAGWRELRAEPGLIPGVEVTAGRDGHEIHIVALGIDPEHGGFAVFLQDIRDLRRARLARLISSLGLDGRLSVEDLASAGADSLSRNHLAQAMVRLGRVSSIPGAFDGPIGDDAIAAMDLAPYPSPVVAIAAIRAAGGVAILAHPGMYGDEPSICTLLDLGFDGLEVKHPKLDPELSERLIAQAALRGLYVSCGSDTHWLGARQPGDYRLPKEQAWPLLKRLGVAA